MMNSRHSVVAILLCLLALDASLAQVDSSSSFEEAIRRAEVAMHSASLSGGNEAAVRELELALATGRVELARRKKMLGGGHPDVDAAEETLEDVQVLLDQFQSNLRIYRLRNVDTISAEQLVRSLLRGDQVRIAADVRTNSLIVSAPEQSHQKLEQVLQAIDAAAAERPPVVRYELPSAKATNLVVAELEKSNLIREWSSQQNKSGSQLTVTAKDPSLLDEIETIVDRVQEHEAPKSYTIRVVWLMSDLTNPKPTPEDMEPVIAELEKQGFKGMRVAAQTSVRTLGRFSISCLAKTVPDATSQLSAQGMITDNGMDISLFAKEDKTELARISTSIKAPPGHPVVLGVSPINAMDSAFVVVVSEND